MADVPCGGCTLCCQADAIVLHPECGDNPGSYITELGFHPFTGRPVTVLAKGPDGVACVYLGPDGCTIHGRAPHICKEFDCRRLYKMIPRAKRRQLTREGIMSREIFDRGRQLLEESDD